MNNWKKNVFSILAASTLLLTVSNSAFASSNMTTEVNSNNEEISVELASGVSFSVEDDGYYDDAILISEKSIHDTPNVYETIRTYKMPDNSISTSTLSIELDSTIGASLSPMSTSGSANNVTYTRNTTMAKVSIIASFDWYESGAWSYVQCSNMTAYYVADSSEIACSRFNKSKSDGYQKVGKAWAQVEYAFYNKNVPVAGIDGTFKVTCSDTGAISS